MKKYGIVTAIIISLVFISCSGSKSTSTRVLKPNDAVGEVGGEFVSYAELKKQYISGSMNEDFSLKELQDFLPVYLDYKGKIAAAKDAGYFEDGKILAELNQYAKQAAYAYWVDNEIRPTKFQEFKQRYEKEYKSYHILIALPLRSPPEDTLETYNKIMEARERFLAGESIEHLNEEYSSTRDGRLMGGDLPWFSVGTTVKEFEDALFQLEKGEISMPVRTQFGYHLILLQDVRDRVPARKVSHIFFRPNEVSDSLANAAYTALKNGMSWEEAVRTYSQDQPSVTNQGYIGWIDYGSRYNPQFVYAVMNIDPSQAFSSPVRSPYGYHIFRIDSIRTFPSEEEKDAFILQLLKNSNSYQENNSFVVNYLKQKYDAITFTENLSKFESVIKKADSTSFAEMDIEDSLRSLPAFSIKDYTFTLDDYMDYLASSRSSVMNVNYQNNWSDTFEEKMIDSIITDLTLENFPEFEQQINEFKYGLVVYQINEDSVWSNATIDTTFLYQRYQNNIDQYRYEDRHFYYLITSFADSSLLEAKEFILSGNSPDSLISHGIKVGVTSDSTGAFKGHPFDLLEEMNPGEFSPYLRLQ